MRILDLYVKEMDRLRTMQAPPPIRKNPRTVGELYKPGTYDIYSDFFHFYSGSQPPTGDWSPWVNEEQKELAERYREATVRHFEDFWVRCWPRRSTDDCQHPLQDLKKHLHSLLARGIT